MKFYLETYGCQANKSDSEIITALLNLEGYRQVKREKDADVLIFNTCYVKQSTQNRIINRLKEIKKLKKRVIVSGCMPEISPETIRKILPKSILVSARNVHHLSEAIKRKKDFLGKPEFDKTLLAKCPASSTYTIQISEGCPNKCSYCAAKLARGHIHSFPEENILEEARKAISKGYKIIHIASQDNAAYGLDKNKISLLPQLLNKLTQLHGNFMIKVGMMNPVHLLPILDNLIFSYQSPKIMKFIHVPVQSGSDGILKDMNRKYTLAEFKKIISSFRKTIPDISISTDVIVGYPTETEEDFKKTLNLIKTLKPEILNISRYSKRPNTPAEHLRQLSTQELKHRSIILTDIYKKYKK